MGVHILQFLDFLFLLHSLFFFLLSFARFSEKKRLCVTGYFFIFLWEKPLVLVFKRSISSYAFSCVLPFCIKVQSSHFIQSSILSNPASVSGLNVTFFVTLAGLLFIRFNADMMTI